MLKMYIFNSNSKIEIGSFDKFLGRLLQFPPNIAIIELRSSNSNIRSNAVLTASNSQRGIFCVRAITPPSITNLFFDPFEFRDKSRMGRPIKQTELLQASYHHKNGNSRFLCKILYFGQITIITFVYETVKQLGRDDGVLCEFVCFVLDFPFD